jgi:hypothetical protein
MSLLEESTVAVNRPMVSVFNNLVMYDQHVPQNSPKCGSAKATGLAGRAEAD